MEEWAGMRRTMLAVLIVPWLPAIALVGFVVGAIGLVVDVPATVPPPTPPDPEPERMPATAPLTPVVTRGQESPALVYLASRHAGSQRVVGARLRAILDVLTNDPSRDVATYPWGSLRWQHVRAARTRLEDRFAPATRPAVFSALRGVLRAAHELGQMPADALVEVMGELGASRLSRRTR